MNIIFLLLGLATGSFLNLCIDRVPRGESVIRNPSRCDACRHRLGSVDLLPLASYLYLKGRCRHCGASIHYRTPLVEAATGIIFVLLWYYYGPSLELLLAVVFTCLLTVILVIDLEHHLIPNRVIYPSLAIAFLVPALIPGYTVTSAAAGALTGAGMLLPLALLFPSGMGMGDVKLAALMGLLLGFPRVFVAILATFVTGGSVASVLLITGVKGRKDPIPLAPFFVTGLVVTMLYGQEILKLFWR